MSVYVALLRAVNVGGTGTLPMEALRRICVDAGFDDPQTYIASGNVVFAATGAEAAVQSALEERLGVHFGKPIGVVVRTAAEMAAVLAANPFPEDDPKTTVAIFLHGPPPPDTLTGVKGQASERLALGRREIYVSYPDGQGRSRLKIAAAAQGTARNMNTIRKLVEMAGAERI